MLSAFDETSVSDDPFSLRLSIVNMCSVRIIIIFRTVKRNMTSIFGRFKLLREGNNDSPLGLYNDAIAPIVFYPLLPCI